MYVVSAERVERSRARPQSVAALEGARPRRMSYQDLLRDPDFTRAVNTIAVQCSVNVDKLKCQGG
jgi:hypothetical protein